jgi:uncharacterized repeat protein (TIGR04076 family)
LRISLFLTTFAAKFGVMNKIRITAIRQTIYQDLMAQYENPIEHACTVQQGQQWISINGQRPDGLCLAAWASMREFVESLARGNGNFYDGWMKNPMSAMISCNDGFRPFSFYIEVIKEPKEPTAVPQKTAKPLTKTDARVQKLILVVGKQALPRRQIIADLGLKQHSRKSLLENYLWPAQEQGYIEFAYPNSPHKPEQAYKLTEKGLALYHQLL